MRKESLTERLSKDEQFRALVAAGHTIESLNAHFPSVGHETCRKARRLVQGTAPSAPKAYKVPKPDSPAPDAETVEVSGQGDKRAVSVTTARLVNDAAALLEVCGLDPLLWDVDSWKVKSYQVTISPRATRETETDGWVRPDAEPVTKQMYSYTATFKLRKVVDTVQRDVLAIIEGLKAHAPIYPAVHPGDHYGDRMAVFSIADAHLGKLAWHKECGANYDLNIAIELYKSAVMHLIAELRGSFDHFLYVPGNDFSNSDNVENRTTRGTEQTTDGRHLRTFVKGHELHAWAIELLAQHAPVTVRPVPGNHDQQTTFYMGEVLRMRFDKHPHVTVENNPTTRKYHEWGENLIGLTHGDKEAHKILGSVMASEQKHAWARTRFREWLIGHLHKSAELNKFADEQHGVPIVVIPSLCAAEDWHTEMGYIGNIRRAVARVYDRSNGLCATHYYTVPADYCTPSGA